MSSRSPRPWEIWHARFEFQGKSGYKYRPVVVIAVKDGSFKAAMVTSAANKLRLENDLAIADWRRAGLDKPSIMRPDRIVEIPMSYIGSAGRIGKLSSQDAAALKRVLASLRD